MKLPHFQLVTVFFCSAMLAVGCGDDRAREAASTQALEATKAAPTAEQPAPAAQPHPTDERPKTGGTMNLTISGQSAERGAQACVAVSAKNFKSIVSVQYTLKWDPKVLKFKQLQGFGLPQLSADNFGAHAVGQGTLTHSWFDGSVKGVSKGDGETLYEVCFEAIGAAGSKSAVQVVNAPVIVEIANLNSEFLTLDATPGTVLVK